MSNSIKIGPKIKRLAKVNISRNTIKAGESVGLYPNSEAMPLSHLILKPLSHFNFKSSPVSPSEQKSKTGNYVLNITVLTGCHHQPDQQNAIECKTVGKNVLVFINYTIENNIGESGDYQNYRYRIEFAEEFTKSIRGKEILIVTASGDPEEGDASKVIIEDEDEI